ncbi:MAG: hypothetical protein ABIV43_00910 [Candidatus Saccharimonadales bacterium]
MDTISKPDSDKRLAHFVIKSTPRRQLETIRKQLRYEELDAEYIREKQRLSRLVKQVRLSLIDRLRS